MNKEERNAYARKWRAKNKEKLRAQSRARYAADPEYHKAKARKHILNYRKNNPDANRGKHYKSRYGITIEDYKRMLAEQNGLCAICKQPETRKGKNGEILSLSIDHDHKTGKVRDLLCTHCNQIVGFMEAKNIPAVEVEKYIKKHKGLPSE